MTFKIPEDMEPYRVKEGFGASPRGLQKGGFFLLTYNATDFKVIAYDGNHDGWEHVSISNRRRCPNWKEMCYFKSIFWDDEDCVMQLHPPKSEWINNHNTCLHLWRPKKEIIPTPPGAAVGIKGLEIT